MKQKILYQTDGYKPSHWQQYPPGMTHAHFYMESRGGMFDAVRWFGLQYYLMEYLAGPRFTLEDVDEATKFYEQYLGPGVFNTAGWKSMFNKYSGRLPIKIRSVPEGSVVDVHNVLMTIENTDPEFPWLPGYLESLLLKVWYPSSVATLSMEIKKVMRKFLRDTCDPPEWDSIGFMLNDFGYRGVTSEEQAALGGAAHLLNFMGSDNIAGIQLLRNYYKADMPAVSIPAMEHSTVTTWGQEHEVDAYRNMLQKFPEHAVACVSDSYNIYNAVEKLWGGVLRDEVNKRDGRHMVIIRPDSGNPREVVLRVLAILGDKFGSTTNSKGYRELSPHVRVIQGDGVNLWTIQDCLTAMQKNGWAACNIAFGMGGALLQQLNRDTQRWATKCSAAVINGKEVDVYKRPIDDAGKESKKGRLALHFADGLWTTARLRSDEIDPDDVLETVFKDGAIMKYTNLSAVQAYEHHWV